MPADSLERVFSLIEMNAPRVPVFRRFLAGEPLDAADVVVLEQATRELGLFDFARLISQATPEALGAIAQAHDAIERASRVRKLFAEFFR
jgi:hypothetical protein